MAKPSRVAKSTTKKAMKDYPSLTDTVGRLTGQVPEKRKQKPKNKYGEIVGTVSDRLGGAVTMRLGKSVNTQMKTGLSMQMIGDNKKIVTPNPKPKKVVEKKASISKKPTTKRRSGK